MDTEQHKPGKWSGVRTVENASGKVVDVQRRGEGGHRYRRPARYHSPLPRRLRTSYHGQPRLRAAPPPEALVGTRHGSCWRACRWWRSTTACRYTSSQPVTVELRSHRARLRRRSVQRGHRRPPFIPAQINVPLRSSILRQPAYSQRRLPGPGQRLTMSDSGSRTTSARKRGGASLRCRGPRHQRGRHRALAEAARHCLGYIRTRPY